MTYYKSIFEDETARRRKVDATPPAVVGVLAKFGLSVPTGEKWKVARLDGYLAQNKVSLENRLLIKSALRQIDGIE